MLAAASMVAVVGFLAVAVDLGAMFLQARKLQGMADLAAISAADDLTGAQAAAEATVAANGWPSGAVATQVSTGVYAPDPEKAADARFAAGAAPPNAARVTLRAPAQLFFARLLIGDRPVEIARTGTAARAELASFSIGSRLASLNGGVANALLSGLTGSEVNLSVMDYEALLKADVQLFDYLDALSTDLQLDGASYDEVLRTRISGLQALGPLARLLDDQGEDRAAAAVRALAQATGDLPVDLKGLFDLGPYGAQDRAAGAGVALNALGLTNAMLQLAGGERQVKLDLGAGVPGLADVDVWLAVGEPPAGSAWLAITDSREVIVRTAQTRLYVEAKTPASGLLALAGAAQVKLPLIVEAASAEARLHALNCAGRSGELSVRPSVGFAAIGEVDVSRLDDFQQPLTVSRAQLITTPLLKASALARADLGGETWKTVAFAGTDIEGGVTKTVATDDIVRASVSSLLGGLDLRVDLLGLGIVLGQGPVTSLLRAVLQTLAAPLDGVVNSLTSLLGVGLGEADVRMNGISCRPAVLVA
ncbi:MAG: hypothetical protein IT546_02885 [Caulobacteraceae bacterium]|nr:hypothetical protein [Caulobacteraceae bacterium]